MTPETYISTARRGSQWRVAVKRFSGNLNTRDATFAERLFRSESAAKRFIADWQRQNGGSLRVQGPLSE